MPCDFGSPTSLSDTDRSNANRFAFWLVNVGNSLITSSLAIFVEEVSLVYVAHGGIIGVVSIGFLPEFLPFYFFLFHTVSSNDSK